MFKVTIEKSNNIGNTFDGLVCAAFDCKIKDIRKDYHLQHGDCGTIEVFHEVFDWFDRGDRIEFIAAN